MPPNPRAALVALVLAAAAVASTASCADPQQGAPAETTVPGATDTAPPVETVPGETTTTVPEPARVGIGSSELGAVLVDGDGATLYVLVTGTCQGACLEAWPPLDATHGLSASPDLQAAELTTVVNADGTPQAAYRGRPLHRFLGDVAPGELTGQGFNGVWFAVAPDGSPLTATPRR